MFALLGAEVITAELLRACSGGNRHLFKWTMAPHQCRVHRNTRVASVLRPAWQAYRSDSMDRGQVSASANLNTINRNDSVLKRNVTPVRELTLPSISLSGHSRVCVCVSSPHWSSLLTHRPSRPAAHTHTPRSSQTHSVSQMKLDRSFYLEHDTKTDEVFFLW